MDNNTVKVDGVEVYLHDIYYYVDEFVNCELNGDGEAVRSNFLRMIYYIADHIERPGNDDIELLDKIFDAFVHLCVRYNVLPTLEAFSFLIKTNRATFSDWRNEEYRKGSGHSNAVKKWFDTCKSFAVERLHNSEKTDVNLIFVAKAAYKMRETSPDTTEDIVGIPLESPREIAVRRAEAIPEKPK